MAQTPQSARPFPSSNSRGTAVRRLTLVSRGDGTARSAPGDNRRASAGPDRRVAPRGGRRETDLPGQYPPVLVGDSDDGARRVFARCLERFGFQVIEATEGDHALALAESNLPAVVISESTLPRDDQFQAYVHMRGIPYIVTMTNDLGVVPPDAVAVLEKPFSLTRLLEEVFRVLRADHRPAVA